MQESNTVVIRVRAADEERAKQILFQGDNATNTKNGHGGQG
jgi:hypothetical protein